MDTQASRVDTCSRECDELQRSNEMRQQLMNEKAFPCRRQPLESNSICCTRSDRRQHAACNILLAAALYSTSINPLPRLPIYRTHRGHRATPASTSPLLSVASHARANLFAGLHSLAVHFRFISAPQIGDIDKVFHVRLHVHEPHSACKTVRSHGHYEHSKRGNASH